MTEQVTVFEVEVEELRLEVVSSRYIITASSPERAMQKAWLGIYDMRHELSAAELRVEVSDVLPPPDVERGGEVFSLGPYCVYVLWGDDEDHPLYVGQSTNLLARLGQHMNDTEKRSRTKRVEVIQCESRDEMCDTERTLIQDLEPYLNTVHNVDALFKRGELEVRPWTPKS